jgi:UDP-glucuronate 4-epimerase
MTFRRPAIIEGLMRVFVTGTAGFIGFHLADRLLREGHLVFGFDALTPYYDPRLKEARRALLLNHDNYRDTIAGLEDMTALVGAIERSAADVVVHLAAQAGVRYSLENPRAYVDSNFVGTFNLLEAVARKRQHFLMASTSSVYGANASAPFFESDKADHPLTIYAATKKANEVMAHSYAHLWSLPTTVFRFFTVYGPWGRPDMAPFKFLESIENDRAIDVYNHGDMQRDFTYIDDLIEAIMGLIKCVPAREAAVADDSLSPIAPFRIVNIGRGEPVDLLSFIAIIEEAVGKKAKRNYLPMQPGEMARTYADSSLLERLTGNRPHTSLKEGVTRFVGWYRDYRAQYGAIHH